MLKFHVLIAVHGRSDLLNRTLQSLERSGIPSSLEKIVVVENASKNGVKEVCERLSCLPIEYYHLEQSGKSRALQWALENIIKVGPVIFFDDDIRIAPSTLAAYVDAVEKHGPNHYFGGPFGVDYEREPPQEVIPYLPLSAVGWRPEPGGGEGGPYEDSTFIGFNYAAFAEEILEAGGFNAEIGPGSLKPGTEGNPTGQEKEMQRRLMSRGVKPVFVEKALVWHYVPTQRCSAEWAMHRRYRVGITKGLCYAKTGGWQLGGVPVWALRRALRGRLETMTTALSPYSEQLDARMRYQYAKGFVVGCRLQKTGIDGKRMAIRRSERSKEIGSPAEGGEV